MSLINKMLQDLESRTTAPAPAIPEKSAFDGLRPVRISAERPSGRKFAGLFVLLAVAVSGAFAWKQWGSGLSPEPSHARAPKAHTATAPTNVSNPAGPTEPANTPAKSAEAVAAVESVPVAREEAKVSTVAPAPAVHTMPSVPAPGKSVTPAKKKPSMNAVAAAKPVAPVTPAREEEASDAGRVDKKIRPLTAEEQAESNYRQAVNLLQQGRKSDAEPHLRLVLVTHPGHIKARELLAGLELQNGRWREAQRDLEQGLAKVPAYYPFAQLLARVYVEHGSDQKAMVVMESSRQAGASNADFMAFLAELYRRAGRHPDAIKAYAEAINLNPQEGRWWLGMGISQEAGQDWKAASEAYQRAIGSGGLDDNLRQYATQRLAVVKNK